MQFLHDWAAASLLTLMTHALFIGIPPWNRIQEARNIIRMKTFVVIIARFVTDL